MSERERALYEAAVALLPHLEASTDKRGAAWMEEVRNYTRAQRLRREADEIEARDAAIERFRKAVAALAPPDDNTGLRGDVEKAVRDALDRRDADD